MGQNNMSGGISVLCWLAAPFHLQMSYRCMKRNSIDVFVKSHQKIDYLSFNLAVNKAAKIKYKCGSIKYWIFWLKYGIVNNVKIESKIQTYNLG